MPNKLAVSMPVVGRPHGFLGLQRERTGLDAGGSRLEGLAEISGQGSFAWMSDPGGNRVGRWKVANK